MSHQLSQNARKMTHNGNFFSMHHSLYNQFKHCVKTKYHLVPDTCITCKCSRSWTFNHSFYYRMLKMFTWSSVVRRNWPRRSWFYKRQFERGIVVDASWRWRTAVSQCKQHGGRTLPEKDSLWYWHKDDYMIDEFCKLLVNIHIKEFPRQILESCNYFFCQMWSTWYFNKSLGLLKILYSCDLMQDSEILA